MRSMFFLPCAYRLEVKYCWVLCVRYTLSCYIANYKFLVHYSSTIKARWGPFIRFRIKSYFAFFLQWRSFGWAVCPTGYFLQGLWKVGWRKGRFGDIEKAKCCKPNILPDRYEDCYDEPIFWSSYDIRKSISCTKGAFYQTGFQTSGCLALGSLRCIKKLRCCMMVLGESPC